MLIGIDAYTTADLPRYATNHFMLLEALKTRDVKHIEQVFRQHYTEVGRALVQRMKEQSRLAGDNNTRTRTSNRSNRRKDQQETG
jgi:DNA-binding GntR family transcriptional regulator